MRESESERWSVLARDVVCELEAVCVCVAGGLDLGQFAFNYLR